MSSNKSRLSSNTQHESSESKSLRSLLLPKEQRRCGKGGYEALEEEEGEEVVEDEEGEKEEEEVKEEERGESSGDSSEA